MKNLVTKGIIAWVVAAVVYPAAVFALGLGKIDLKSGLDQPFDARIQLLSPTRDELDSLNVALADMDAFERAGIQRPFVLSELKFEVKENDHGADYIHVYSKDPIREPYLDFLVEASWSKGRLYREYTVLLDPPLYDANAHRVEQAPAPELTPTEESNAPAGMPQEESSMGTVAPAESSEPAPAVAPGGDYGPTVSTDTLWSIAGKTRPDASVTMQQMMLALLKANPDAFTSDNVNALKRGVVLHVPSRDEINALTPEQAMSEVKSQYAIWSQARANAAANVQERPEGESTAEGTAAPATKPEAAAPADKSELRLVAAGSETKGDGSSGASTSGDSAKKLQLAQEQLDSMSQENSDLKNRLSDSENIISDLKRLISLKDKELASLQDQLAGAKKQPAPEAAAPAGKTAETAPAKAPTPENAAPTAAPKPAKPAPAATKPAATAPAKQAAPVSGGGMLDKLVQLAKANLVFVVAGVGLLIVVLGVLIWIKRRRSDEVEAAEVVDFPEISASEDETFIPGAEDELTAEPPEPPEAPKAKARPEPSAKPQVEESPEPEEPSDATVIAPAPATPAPAAVAPEPEEDPLAEVNVFLAYEHFDQAEDFVREAIAREPDNLEFHSKLLEVFYAANDKKKYEEAAKVLHDKVDGRGPHWDMAVAMWNEMSPNRGLFEAGAGAEEEAAPGTAGGGMLDLTAEESGGAAPESEGLDFDLGDTAAPAAKEQSDDAVLDLTAGSEDEGGLEFTSGQSDNEDLLDVTAAVGLEPEAEVPDLPEEEGVLDVTGGAEQGGEDLLDVSTNRNEGLLDVTAHADLEGESIDDNLLDVTAVSGGTNKEDEPEPELEPELDTGGSVDLDLGTGPDNDNVIDFESAGATDGGEEAAQPDGESSDDMGLEFDLSTDSEEQPAEDGGEISLEDMSADEGLELQLDDSALELQDEDAKPDTAAGGDAGDDGGFDLDLTLDDNEPAKSSADDSDIDMEGTVEIPKLEIADEDEDDDSDHTVFVPRTRETQEQSADDEIATKLDLAKAYVELGDKDSAKGILDEVMADGNDQQKRQAGEMLKQLS